MCGGVKPIWGVSLLRGDAMNGRVCWGPEPHDKTEQALAMLKMVLDFQGKSESLT